MSLSQHIPLSEEAGTAVEARARAPQSIMLNSDIRRRPRQNAKGRKDASQADLVLFIEGSEFAIKSCVYLRCIQCHVN